MKKKLLAVCLSAAMLISLVACGDSAQSGNVPEELTDEVETSASNDEGTTASAEGGLNVCIASEPESIDPALNKTVDGATMLVHLFSGLAKWEKDGDSLKVVPDAATELPEGVVNEDGTVTYTYTLRDGLKWSDGKDVTAGDFEFAWKRASSVELAADYGYMFELVDGYAEVWDLDDDGNHKNPDAELNVKAVDDKTLEVTIENKVPYWNELLAFPAFLPVREDVVSNEAWATDPSTYVCNGPYTLTDWEHNSLITLKKNDSYVDADKIKAVAEYLQSAFAAVGITLNLENQEWATFVNTRKEGNYSVARNGWLADYNDPISFLDLWTSTSGNNDSQIGKGEHGNAKIYDLDLTEFGYDTKVEGGTWAETYDVLISTIKSCEDDDARYKMMHKAEDMLMETGCICPLFYYTDIYMIDKSVDGFFANPLGFKYFMYSTIK